MIFCLKSPPTQVRRTPTFIRESYFWRFFKCILASRIATKSNFESWTIFISIFFFFAFDHPFMKYIIVIPRKIILFKMTLSRVVKTSLHDLATILFTDDLPIQPSGIRYTTPAQQITLFRLLSFVPLFLTSTIPPLEQSCVTAPFKNGSLY